MKKHIFAAILLGVLAPASLLAQKEISKSFTGVKSIRIQTASGDCKIVKGTNASVGVTVRHGYDEKNMNRSSNKAVTGWAHRRL